jgi:hypothetical protein
MTPQPLTRRSLLVGAGALGVVAATGVRVSASMPARVYGLAVPSAQSNLATLDQVNTEVGVPAQQVTWYQQWAYGGSFPAAAAAAIASRGAVPEMVWEPWDPTKGVTQPAYSLAQIAAGAYDSYLNQWARQIKQYGGPLVIRFAHEMNGNWYPWAEGVNGNASGSYVAAWRHVVRIFTNARVHNVTWQWTANVPYTGSVPLAGLYPGSAYVQRVALDGYNFGTSQTWSSWQEFGSVFGPGVAALRQLTGQWIYISETGCSEVGGNKATWIQNMWGWLAQHPEVRGLTWFDFNKETDWRIDSSASSLSAFRAGVSAFESS